MSDSSDVNLQGIRSLLDTDMYKLTMQAAILEHFPDVMVSYRFYNRNMTKSLNRSAYEWLRSHVTALSSLQFEAHEIDFLRSSCPFLPKTYYTYLERFQLDVRQCVKLTWDETSEELSIDIHGLWKETILLEIPILSLISEAYFRFVDTDWSHEGQKEKAHDKAVHLMGAGCNFSEFGTRRRRDYKTQDLVLQGLLSASMEIDEGGGVLVGTSNVHFAQKYKLKPIGTVAHEWFMGTAAITKDYLQANKIALTKWRTSFGDELGIALTDTFGTNAFLQNFSVELARQFAGVRQDSGSPEAFAGRMVQFYQDRGIDPKSKSIVFSDGLNVDKCINLQKLCVELGIKCSFGIGTHLTNDFTKASTGVASPAMNIVIKLSSAAGQPAIKISDEVGKHTGDNDLLQRVQKVLLEAEKYKY